jgi:hypothetical protein
MNLIYRAINTSTHNYVREVGSSGSGKNRLTGGKARREIEAGSGSLLVKKDVSPICGKR